MRLADRHIEQGLSGLEFQILTLGYSRNFFYRDEADIKVGRYYTTI